MYVYKEKAILVRPWYCVLEGVMRERSHFIPEATCDGLVNISHNSFASKMNLNQSHINMNDWNLSENNNTTPCQVVLSDLEEKEGLKVEEEFNPHGSQRKNKINFSMWSILTPPYQFIWFLGSRISSSGSWDSLGLQTLMNNFLPSKSEREATAREERKKDKQKMQLTSKISKAITTMSQNWRDDVQLKREHLHGKAVTQFLGMGETFDEAFKKALMMYPKTHQAPEDSQQACGSGLGRGHDDENLDTSDSSSENDANIDDRSIWGLNNQLLGISQNTLAECCFQT